MTHEIWKPVTGFEQFYAVSSLGGLKSLACTRQGPKGLRRFRERILKTNYSYGGVLRLRGFSGEERVVQLHRLIAETFVLNPERLPCVCHKNDNSCDNRAVNLYWGSKKDNSIDAVRNRRMVHKRGEENGMSKLTESQIHWIRKTWCPWSRTKGVAALAKQLGVARGAVTSVIYGRTWGHV